MSRWFAALALVGLALVAYFWLPPSAPAAPKAGSVVKIINGPGHGSGVHIGTGYILTAAHVIREADFVDVLSDQGLTTKAEVLWVNKAYDLALVRDEGASVTLIGNPADVEFLKVQASIAGKARPYARWRSVSVVSGPIVPGMSGGGMFDRAGNLRGIVVGVMLAPTGPFSSSMVGIGYAVPSSAACALMGRAVPA
ncbi:serine protease [Chelatococcus sp.]|uniref:S1 family peptidase n=1 Tax=Chelatococcus sp. TaxID=1953771 RepID=UPI001EC6CC16|nr:serine protease [Chelatococcus sp.]MBX3543734.1 trypsin-like peptidase domain-containing protein [Chelatococcus sp.]CAH1677686.1 Serine protease Do [Hyphomicrobiales bacterium]